MTKNSSLLVIDAHGVYIPQLFAQSYAKYITNMLDIQEDYNILLLGPDNEYYWGAWDVVESNAKLLDDYNRECVLLLNGDLWAIPVTELDQIPEF